MNVQRDARARRTQVDRRSEAEEALLDAAAALFAERGIVQTSLAEIGEKAGYSRGLANHHFGSKAELVERLARRSQDRFMGALERVEGSTGLDEIVRTVDAYLRHFEKPTPEGRSLLVMWGATFPNGSSLAGIADADGRARDAFARGIARGKRDGSISPQVDGRAFAVALLGLIRGVAAQFLTERDPVDTRAVRAQCRRFVTIGLSPTRTKE